MKQEGMNLDVRESLSAGIDGELSKEQLRFLLRRLDHDAALQETWSRYHLARDGVRRAIPPMASAGFAERVMLAVDQAPAAAVATRRGHWLRWSAGGAIAASVAAAALMISQPAGEGDRGMAATAMQASTATRALPASGTVVAPASMAAMPAAVPPWLSSNSAGLMSQQASFGESPDRVQVDLARHPNQFPPLRRYRMLNNHDGSYLLLLDPAQQPAGSGSVGQLR